MHKTVSRTNYADKFQIAVYRDQGKWVAHNLSLDIVATSRSKAQALKEMRVLTVNQVSFAIDNGMPDAITHPAPARFWEKTSKKITATLVGKLFREAGEASGKVKAMLERSPVIDITQPRRLA